MRIANILVASALISLAAPAAAGDWRFLNIGKSGENRTVMFIDAATVKVTGPVVRYWRDMRLKFPLESGPYSVNRMVELLEVDCTESRHRTLQARGYDGATYALDLEADGDWEYAAPDTNMSGEIRRVCMKRWGDTSLDRDRAAAAVLEKAD